MKRLIDFILQRYKKPKSAHIAKERLQIIVAHERSQSDRRADFMPALQKEIIDVMAKYFQGIDRQSVKVELQRTENCSVLELNILLPESEKKLEEV